MRGMPRPLATTDTLIMHFKLVHPCILKHLVSRRSIVNFTLSRVRPQCHFHKMLLFLLKNFISKFYFRYFSKEVRCNLLTLCTKRLNRIHCHRYSIETHLANPLLIRPEAYACASFASGITLAMPKNSCVTPLYSL